MSSSSDSDTSERVKNVRSALIKLKEDQQESELFANHSYKRKLGDLIFDASFEAGNLGYVERVDRYNYDLMVRPDGANPRHRLWFYFSTSNQLPGQCVIFNLVNLSDYVPAFHEGLTPVARSRSRPNWVRLNEDQVFYHRSQNHRKRYILSIAFKFDIHDDEHQFALLYPYTLTMLSSFISRWNIEIKRDMKLRELSPRNKRITPEPNHDRENLAPRKNYIQVDGDIMFEVYVIAWSVLSKPIYHISVGNGIKQAKPIVLVVCRQGGNLDSAASFVCQGAMDFALSKTTTSCCIRDIMQLHFMPMIDVDSICVGNSRTDILGQPNQPAKLSRASKGYYSNFIESRRVIEKFCATGTRVIIIDLRVNLRLIGCRIIGGHHDDSIRMERNLQLPRLMSRFCDSFYLENCHFIDPNDPAKFLLNNPGDNVEQYRFEISPHAAYKRSLSETSYENYDQVKYMTIGKALLYSLLELLRSKDRELPPKVYKKLKSFRKTPDEIDHLKLSILES